MPSQAAWASALHKLRFSHFGVEHGLPSGAVLSLLQDRHGLMWLGTTSGLARLDGHEVKVFKPIPERSDSLSHGLVEALLEDEQGVLWIGTRSGLDRMPLSTEKIQRQTMPESFSLGERRVMALAPAGPQRLWVATVGGLLMFNTAEQRFIAWQKPGDERLAFKRPIRALLPDGQGGVWVAESHEVSRINAQGQLLVQFGTLNGLGADAMRAIDLQVTALAQDAHGRLWVGMIGGLQTWRLQDQGPPRPDPLAQRLNLPKDRIYSLMRDRDQAMWVGAFSRPALYRWSEEASGEETGRGRLDTFVKLPAVEASLAEDSVGALMQDRSGALWVGSLSRGVSLADLGGRRFATYLSVPGDAKSLPNDTVMAVVFEGADQAWVGTYGGGLNRLDLPSGDVQRIGTQQMPLTHIKALLREPNGQLWVGGERGLQRFDPKQQRSQTIDLRPESLGDVSVSSLLRMDSGDLWVGSSQGLFRVESSGRIVSYTAKPRDPKALRHAVVDSLLQDRDGRLWVGTKGGLHLWDALTDSFSQPVQGNAAVAKPAHLAVYGLRQDARGRIWVASEQGLFELIASGPNGWQYKAWSEVPGMPSGAFESLELAASGSVWLGSEQGLTEFLPDTQRARFYPASSHFKGGFNFAASARGPDGSLYFGGKGLVRFKPEVLADNKQAPRVVLSDLRVFNQSLAAEASPPSASAGRLGASGPQLSLADLGITGPLHLAQEVKISHRETMVSFVLSALHFNQRSQVRHAWKLEGFDRDWIYGQDNSGVATYTNLDAGQYRLLAKAANPDGVWGEEQMMLNLVVSPPFWRTGWWYTSLVLMALLGLAAAYRWRVSSLHRTRQMLQQQVAARTQQLQEQASQLALEKQLAQTQSVLALQSSEAAEKARHDIALLSEFGRQITGSLDVASIQRTIYQQVGELIEGDVFGLGLVNWPARTVAFDFVIHRGEACKPYVRSLEAVEMPAVQAVLSGKSQRVDQIERDSRVLYRQEGPTRIVLQSGADPAQVHSGIYAPMLLKDRVVGLIFMLSERSHAFQANDLAILETLGAYAAVALDNAEAYRQLKTAQTQLVEQEKMAALGSLVAGVAHELNTPIGNSLLVASTLLDRGRAFTRQLAEGGLRRSELERHCQANEESSLLLVRSLDSAAQLITSFKQLAVDQTSEQRRQFQLLTLCTEIAQTLGNRLRREGHVLHLEVPQDLSLDSFPGPLGQVLTNLVLNAVIHGLEGRREGQLNLSAEALEGERIRLVFSDNGRGISPEHLARVFDPFFTTKLGQGGSGLGLHISYNIVHSVLGGSIEVSSAPGEGARFEIIIPAVAPLRVES
ncbi:two-component regulator propeller domain-containing protein [Roseateles sp.]|uniref:two-component regulator propeller domain-containing protein n=1 Tax=Roseateles sp. TaxID=1971397 RepID=UPI003BA45E80